MSNSHDPAARPTLGTNLGPNSGATGASGTPPASAAPQNWTGVVDRRMWPDRRANRAAAEAARRATDAPNPNAADSTPAPTTDLDAAQHAPRPADAPATTGLERRRGPGRRLSDFTRSAEEGELTKEQFLFLMAIEAFKKANDRPYPTWTDVLEVVRLLGYRKTMPMEVALRNAEDWRESPDAAANVRPARWHQRAA